MFHVVEMCNQPKTLDEGERNFFKFVCLFFQRSFTNVRLSEISAVVHFVNPYLQLKLKLQITIEEEPIFAYNYALFKPPRKL